jgi:hypothetical protein
MAEVARQHLHFNQGHHQPKRGLYHETADRMLDIVSQKGGLGRPRKLTCTTGPSFAVRKAAIHPHLKALGTQSIVQSNSGM